MRRRLPPARNIDPGITAYLWEQPGVSSKSLIARELLPIYGNTLA